VSALDEALGRLATTPVLLAACDYDGTLAPIVDDPSRARPTRESVVALRMLAGLPDTHVAVVSGRAIRDLGVLSGLPQSVHLVGSHGSEFDMDFIDALDEAARARLGEVCAAVAAVADGHGGFLIEHKPASVAFHYRTAPEEEARRAVAAVRGLARAREGVFLKEGKKVVELSVVAMHKGAALETLRHRLGASAVLFVGDDHTDEDAFARLTGPDVSVKVGPGETVATHRLRGPTEVAAMLASLGERRAAWARGADVPPIEEHSMLSDMRTVAFVTPDARLTWCCLPRADAPAVFAELVGGPAAGRFVVRPRDRDWGAPRQRYVDDSLVLETSWPGVRVTDFLDCSGDRAHRRPGRSDLLRVVEGRGKVEIEFAPRLDFGRMVTRLEAREGGLAVLGAYDPLVLYAPGVHWRIVPEGPHQTARAVVELGDEPLVLELRYGTASLRPTVQAQRQRLEHTERFWSSWAQRLVTPPFAPSLLRRSALVLRALVHGPTGALLAAGTTSLPEDLGGVRNWDYRFCWLRDAAMSASALVKLGSLGEAMAYLDWLVDVVARSDSASWLMPLYSVAGHVLGPEAEIGELSGYQGSRPVRVGNAASHQVQLDVFGPIVQLVADLVAVDAPLSGEHLRLVERMVDAVERNWRTPDHGIWEIRKAPRHHVHSKVMCWVSVDRGLAILRALHERDQPRWVQLRDEIAEDVLTHGWKEDVGAFTAAYDGEDLDASTLIIGLVGLLPTWDPRYVATVETIERELRDGPTVYRYRADDGLPGFEGGFHLCASWLVEAYLRVGRLGDARRLFEAYTVLAGRTGLLSEQYDPADRRGLGNHPQAYSHLALIENALSLARLEGG